jgi:hypothetical protein
MGDRLGDRLGDMPMNEQDTDNIKALRRVKDITRDSLSSEDRMRQLECQVIQLGSQITLLENALHDEMEINARRAQDTYRRFDELAAKEHHRQPATSLANKLILLAESSMPFGISFSSARDKLEISSAYFYKIKKLAQKQDRRLVEKRSTLPGKHKEKKLFYEVI